MAWRFTPLADVELGIWCDTCFLPTAGRLTFALEFGDVPISVTTLTHCPDCDSEVYT